MADKKPEKPTTSVSKKIMVYVEDPTVQFAINPDTKLQKLFNAYAHRNGQAVSSLRFLYDGQIIGDHLTPKSLEIEDGDRLHVMMEQVGG